MTLKELQYRAGFDLASFFAAQENFIEAMEDLRKYHRKNANRTACAELMATRVDEIGGFAAQILAKERKENTSSCDNMLENAQFAARNLLHQYSKISAYRIPVDPDIITEAQSIL